MEHNERKAGGEWQAASGSDPMAVDTGLTAVGTGPTAVLMETDEGEREEVFATRFQAELFVYYLPMMALVSAEFAAVRSAILSPLGVVGRAAEVLSN